MSKTEVKLRFQLVRMNPSRTKRGSSVKNCGKIATLSCLLQPLRTKRGSSVQNCGKIAIASVADEPFTHETRFECQKLR